MALNKECLFSGKFIMKKNNALKCYHCEIEFKKSVSRLKRLINKTPISLDTQKNLRKYLLYVTDLCSGRKTVGQIKKPTELFIASIFNNYRGFGTLDNGVNLQPIDFNPKAFSDSIRTELRDSKRKSKQEQWAGFILMAFDQSLAIFADSETREKFSPEQKGEIYGTFLYQCFQVIGLAK